MRGAPGGYCETDNCTGIVLIHRMYGEERQHLLKEMVRQGGEVGRGRGMKKAVWGS